MSWSCKLIRPFCIMLLYRYLLHYGLLLHIMSQYLCLFSLILQGLHEEGECRQLEFWAGKEANIRDLFCTTPKVWNFKEISFGINKKYWAKKAPEGATHCPRGWRARPLPRGPPGSPLMPIFWYKVSFALEKNQKEAFGTKRRRLEAELGKTNLGLRRSCSAGETSLRDGEIIAIVITIDPLIERRSISINIFTSTISSQTLVDLLYPIFVSKAQIGTCGLLVVLITPCSWC